MSEHEICVLYREAKYKKKQIPILVDLACRSKYEIIGILLRNGEELPPGEKKQLYKRLGVLESKIEEMEREYREIVNALIGVRN